MSNEIGFILALIIINFIYLNKIRYKLNSVIDRLNNLKNEFDLYKKSKNINNH